MRASWPLVVWGVYLAGFFAHAAFITALCIAFGLLNMLLGLA